MGARGLEIHNGYMSLPDGIQLGSPSVPLDQIVANSIEVGVAKSVKVATGTEIGLDSTLNVGITGSTKVVGVHTKVSALTTFTLSGDIYGIHVETEILGTAIKTGEMDGLRIEQYVEATATVSGLAVIDIFITSYILSAPQSHTFIWCAENGDKVVSRCMAFYIGGTATVTDFLFLSPKDTGAWKQAGAVSGPTSGYIKISLQGTPKYIPLYDTV